MDKKNDKDFCPLEIAVILLDKSSFYMVFSLSCTISYGLIGNAHSPND